MKAIYKFEEELMQEFDFEPMNDGYNIDDLVEADRQELSGMLWILYDAVKRWKVSEETANDENGTIGKIANEYLGKVYENLLDEIVSSVNEFVVSRIDSYAE